MRGRWIRVFASVLALTAGLWPGVESQAQAPGLPEWTMNASLIEGCSCPLFCPTYFGTKPAPHAEGITGECRYYCRFNTAFEVNTGVYGKTKLDGARFWLAGDRGEDHARGQMEWAALVFEKSMPQDQRVAISALIGFIYPVQFKSVSLSEGDIEWVSSQDETYALLEGGRAGEIRLKRFPGMAEQPVRLQNLRYWGAARNEGFLVMSATLEAYRIGPRPFEARGTTGFTTTIDMSSKDPLSAPGGR
jgi:uncharacterized protein DUF1326